MTVLCCATSAYPTHTLRVTFAKASVCSSSRVSVSQLHLPIPRLYPREVDNLLARNSARILKAFQRVKVGSHHFGGSTGYGHEEAGGREALDQAFTEIVGAESAIVQSQFFSGTHAIICALFAFLRPGDELLAIAGAPYDILEEVIGKRDSDGLGSLKDFGVEYWEVPLAEDGGLDCDALKTYLRPHTKCALIQRACGYSWCHSLSVTEIGRAINIIKMQNPGCMVMVDNCYGEFVDDIEPPMMGADLIAGSLVKNPGGTIAPCGGYVAGRKTWVEATAAGLSAPGLGVDCGSTPGDIMRTLFQGLFLSPQMVGEAIKAVQLGNHEHLLSFCEAVQRSSPVSSFIRPVAGATAAYAAEVIFADVIFIDGSTSELSCDGPLREPFSVFCQAMRMISNGPHYNIQERNGGEEGCLNMNIRTRNPAVYSMKQANGHLETDPPLIRSSLVQSIVGSD